DAHRSHTGTRPRLPGQQARLDELRPPAAADKPHARTTLPPLRVRGVGPRTVRSARHHVDDLHLESMNERVADQADFDLWPIFIAVTGVGLLLLRPVPLTEDS